MYSLAEIKQVQQRLLRMAVVIRDIFIKKDIRYFIAFGTLLGAVRHKGFIPWDDDLDMYVFTEDYQRMIDALQQELPEGMFFEYKNTEPLYFHDWVHVKDCHSICECGLSPDDSLYAHKGISIDLYELKSMTEEEWHSFKVKKAVEYLDRKKRNGFISDEMYSNKLGQIKDLFSMDNTNGNALSDIVYGSSASRYRYPADCILPLTTVRFEEEEFAAPCKVHEVLVNLYGDYMKFPPVDQRKPHYTKVTFTDIEDV